MLRPRHAPSLKILVVAGVNEAVETRHGFAQFIGIDTDSIRQFAKCAGAVDPFRRLTAGSERLQTILFPVLRIEDQITRHIDGPVRQTSNARSLAATSPKEDSSAKRLPDRFTMMQCG